MNGFPILEPTKTSFLGNYLRKFGILIEMQNSISIHLPYYEIIQSEQGRHRKFHTMGAKHFHLGKILHLLTKMKEYSLSLRHTVPNLTVFLPFFRSKIPLNRMIIHLDGCNAPAAPVLARPCLTTLTCSMMKWCPSFNISWIFVHICM